MGDSKEDWPKKSAFSLGWALFHFSQFQAFSLGWALFHFSQFHAGDINLNFTAQKCRSAVLKNFSKISMLIGRRRNPISKLMLSLRVITHKNVILRPAAWPGHCEQCKYPDTPSLTLNQKLQGGPRSLFNKTSKRCADATVKFGSLLSLWNFIWSMLIKIKTVPNLKWLDLTIFRFYDSGKAIHIQYFQFTFWSFLRLVICRMTILILGSSSKPHFLVSHGITRVSWCSAR